MFGLTYIIKSSVKGKWCVPVMKQPLMVQVHGVLVMTLLGILYFLVMVRVHDLMLIIPKLIFLVLGAGPTYDINGSVVAAEQKYSTSFSKARTTLC